MKKLQLYAILLQFVGFILVAFFQVFMQNIYVHKNTIDNEKVILMIMPENRIILWIGFIFLFSGFVLFVIKELNNKENE